MTSKSSTRRSRSSRQAAAARFRRTDLSFAVIALIVVFGSLLGIVVLQTFIVQNRVQLDDVNRQLEVARKENQSLRLSEIELEAPERILAVAVDRLGMVRPTARRYLPGVDPAIDEVRRPASDDPFGPGKLPEQFQPSEDDG